MDTTDAAGGIARLDDGFVLFDRHAGVVQALDSSGHERWRYGRTGNGPGELASYAMGESQWFGRARWIHARNGAVAVYDGRSILRIQNGKLAREDQVPRQLVGGFSKVHLVHWLNDTTVLLAVARDPLRVSDDSERWRLDLHRFTPGGASDVLVGFRSRSWPTLPSGLPVHGLGEASPNVAAQGRCAVFNDGHDDSLYIVDLLSGARAVRRMPIPAHFVDAADDEAYRRLGVPPSATVPVKYPSRVKALALTPDGTVWLWPARSMYEGEVWRYREGDERITYDTLNAAAALGIQANR